MPLAIGTRLGPYEILAALGAGGMGEVYRAKDTRLDRSVAVKVLPSHFTDDPERRARFEADGEVSVVVYSDRYPILGHGAATAKIDLKDR